MWVGLDKAHADFKRWRCCPTPPYLPYLPSLPYLPYLTDPLYLP